ncbi:MAG: hypothetical protein KA116_07790 [Proteobacteria bacterium]|nr:hypothetical protein [Pseudomonadota bacterium]
MSFLSEILDPGSWAPKHYALFSLCLVSINLLGPRGWVHHYYIKQEIKVTNDKILKEKMAIAEKEESLQRLRKSTKLKERLIREELGFLKDDEWSIEFYPTKNVAALSPASSLSRPLPQTALKNQKIPKRH